MKSPIDDFRQHLTAVTTISFIVTGTTSADETAPATGAPEEPRPTSKDVTYPGPV